MFVLAVGTTPMPVHGNHTHRHANGNDHGCATQDMLLWISKAIAYNSLVGSPTKQAVRFELVVE